MLTGVISGSDIDVLAVVDMQSMGLFGENHTGSDENLVWITKAHYPLAFFETEPRFTANK